MLKIQSIRQCPHIWQGGRLKSSKYLFQHLEIIGEQQNMVSIMNKDRDCTSLNPAFFDMVANNPDSWLEPANRLVNAALILFKNRESFKFSNSDPPRKFREFSNLLWPELMLWGMAIECFFKCLT